MTVSSTCEQFTPLRSRCYGNLGANGPLTRYAMMNTFKLRDFKENAHQLRPKYLFFLANVKIEARNV